MTRRNHVSVRDLESTNTEGVLDVSATCECVTMVLPNPLALRSVVVVDAGELIPNLVSLGFGLRDYRQKIPISDITRWLEPLQLIPKASLQGFDISDVSARCRLIPRWILQRRRFRGGGRKPAPVHEHFESAEVGHVAAKQIPFIEIVERNLRRLEVRRGNRDVASLPPSGIAFFAGGRKRTAVERSHDH